MTELQIILEEKYMIRRLKSQVLSQLPSKQRSDKSASIDLLAMKYA